MDKNIHLDEKSLKELSNVENPDVNAFINGFLAEKPEYTDWHLLAFMVELYGDYRKDWFRTSGNLRKKIMVKVGKWLSMYGEHSCIVDLEKSLRRKSFVALMDVLSRASDQTEERLIKEWIEKGDAILEPQFRELWAKAVPVRLNDLYFGMELEATLEIVKELNAGCSFDEAKTILSKQGHSGLSHQLVLAMITVFCERGREFASFVNNSSS